MTVLYPNPCYNEVCYKGTVLYLFIISEAFVAGRVVVLVNIETVIFIFIPMAHSWKKYIPNGPRRHKACLWGFRQSETQTNLNNYTD